MSGDGETAFTAQQLRFGFVRGTAPQKWVRKWREGEYPVRLVAESLEADFFCPDTHGDLLAAGGVLLTRSVTQPVTHVSGALNAVRVYSESVALLAAADSEIAVLESITDSAELELTQLLDHPLHLRQWPAAVSWQDPAWLPVDSVAAAEIVASGAGAVLLPFPVARQVAQKSRHTVIPVTPEVGLQETSVWAVWLSECDSAVVQDFIGVLKGRRSGSSRTQSTARESAQQKFAQQKSAPKRVKSSAGQAKTRGRVTRRGRRRG